MRNNWYNERSHEELLHHQSQAEAAIPRDSHLLLLFFSLVIIIGTQHISGFNLGIPFYLWPASGNVGFQRQYLETKHNPCQHLFI